MEIDPSGNLVGFDNSEIELSAGEMDQEFQNIAKRYKVTDGRIIGNNMKEYWFPIDAKEDLELIGITWGQKDRATNKEHSDYGKTFWVVDYNSF